MYIAKCGNFCIVHETFLGTRKLTTKTIELCKQTNDKSIFTIAKLTENGDVRSIGDRLIKHIETIEDLENVKKLLKVLYSIYETDDMEIKFN